MLNPRAAVMRAVSARSGNAMCRELHRSSGSNGTYRPASITDSALSLSTHEACVTRLGDVDRECANRPLRLGRPVLLVAVVVAVAVGGGHLRFRRHDVEHDAE